MATFLVLLSRSGSQWDASRPMEEQSEWPAHAAFVDRLVDAGFMIFAGPLADEHRVAQVVEAGTEEEVRATLSRDPWSETHLRVHSVDRWTLRVDSRQP